LDKPLFSLFIWGWGLLVVFERVLLFAFCSNLIRAECPIPERRETSVFHITTVFNETEATVFHYLACGSTFSRHTKAAFWHYSAVSILVSVKEVRLNPE